MPAKRKRIWVVVADGASAQILTENADRAGFVAVRGQRLSNAGAKGHARDLKSDRPGRAMNSDRLGTRHAIEPHHDYHKMEKHKFAAQLAKLLEHARVQDKFDELILVAPRRSLGELRTLLPEGVLARVRREVAKEMTKTTRDDLYRQLAPDLLRMQAF
jgi:protein required for attachment to host cells